MLRSKDVMEILSEMRCLVLMSIRMEASEIEPIRLILDKVMPLGSAMEFSETNVMDSEELQKIS